MVMVRFNFVIFGKILGMPGFFYNFVFLAGLFFIIPLVLVFGHSGARKYFLQRNPRIKKMKKALQDLQYKFGSKEGNNQSSESIASSKNEVNVVKIPKRGRSNSCPNEIKRMSHGKMQKGTSLPKDLEKLVSESIAPSKNEVNVVKVPKRGRTNSCPSEIKRMSHGKAHHSQRVLENQSL